MNQIHQHQTRLRELAHAHRQQAEFHQRQAHFHHHQAMAHEHYASTPHVNPPVYTPTTAYTASNWHGTAGGTTHGNQGSIYANQNVQSAWNNPRYTAANDMVSPTALVFHGQVSPEAIQSLQEFQHPYNQQARSSHVITHPMSAHAVHATDNAHSIHRTGSAYFTT
ncbi:hypothetical protein ACQCN2_06770 [Brevibacillus ginsengisoli]|uniref:hypothetical protein n=1 Tax=Brevibacillus ginsengisoli TaxID=363854 RepID=UPI003CF50F1D